MLYRLLLCLTVLGLLSGDLQADHVIVTGGPALRKWEDLRIPNDRHDRWWANFIRASTIRMDMLIKEPNRNNRIVWMVYKPGYVDRGKEDGKPYVRWIENLATKRKVHLIWFSSADEYLRKFNALPQGSVTAYEYFGHSNKYAFMFEYGSDIIAASTAWLHETELTRKRASVFHPQAACTSWGCHTGESMSQAWKQTLGLPLRGVKGPTNYTVVGQAKLPLAKGSWTQ